MKSTIQLLGIPHDYGNSSMVIAGLRFQACSRWGSWLGHSTLWETHKNYGKSPSLIAKSTNKWAMFNSYVKLPEGIWYPCENCSKYLLVAFRYHSRRQVSKLSGVISWCFLTVTTLRWCCSWMCAQRKDHPVPMVASPKSLSAIASLNIWPEDRVRSFLLRSQKTSLKYFGWKNSCTSWKWWFIPLFLSGFNMF